MKNTTKEKRVPKTDQVFIPGKAYEIVTAAPFMTARNLTDGEREARVALKEGEKRKKGRGYRVLVTLNGEAAIFLCEWFKDFQAGPGYKSLGTAEALAIRTITDRICEFAGECAEAKERRKAAARNRVATMQAGKERKAAEEAAARREANKAEIARLEKMLPQWNKDYDEALTATRTARTTKTLNVAFTRVERLQSTILASEAKLRNLKGE